MNAKFFLVVRLIVGLLLVSFGVGEFFHIITNPENAQMFTPELNAYIGALTDTGYMMPFISIVQFVAGVSFILNKYVPLMSVVILPVILNAALAHLFLDPAGIAPAAVLLVLIIIVMYKNKEAYKTVLKA